METQYTITAVPTTWGQVYVVMVMHPDRDPTIVVDSQGKPMEMLSQFAAAQVIKNITTPMI